MNISDLLTREAFDDFMRKVERKEDAECKQTVKVKDGAITLRLHGRTVQEDLARTIWNGENYICGIEIGCHRTNNIGGSSTPISRSEFKTFTYAQLAREIETRGKVYLPEEYTRFDNYNEQMGFF